MADISKVAYGKEVRPTVIDILNTLNETIDVVNNLSVADYQDQIDALDTKITTQSNRIDSNVADISTLKTENETQQSDIDNIKVTLYTPIADPNAPAEEGDN